MDVGTEVSTEYITDDSEYVSSVEGNTPFPSLSKSKRKIILESIPSRYVSRFSESNIVKPEMIEQPHEEEETPEEKQQEQTFGCCYIC